MYFQVSTGRMPAMRGEAQAPRKAPIFDEHQIDALGAYVQANGGGPTVPRDENGAVAQDSLLGGDVARGGDLFRLNCASCHNFTGKGGALSSGKYAPDLGDGRARADLHRDADRPAEHAEVLRPSAHPRGEARHRRLRPRGDRDARPRRLRPRRLRSRARGHGGLDHRDGRRRSARQCGSERGHERRRQGHRHARADTASRSSPPTPSSPRCRARNWSSSAASSTASRPSSRSRAGRSRAPRPRSAPSARSSYWLLLGGFSGLALLVVFLFWPWEYKPYGSEGELVYYAWPPRCTA